MKMLTFQHDDIIICDVSRALFNVFNRLVMGNLLARFHEDSTINNGDTCLFHVFFGIFRQNGRDLRIMTSLSMSV